MDQERMVGTGYGTSIYDEPDVEQVRDKIRELEETCKYIRERSDVAINMGLQGYSERKVLKEKIENLESNSGSHPRQKSLPESQETVARVEQQQKERELPSYVSKEFVAINENLEELKTCWAAKEQVLFHMGELEALFGKVETKARAIGRKYEGRLASCLRDVCWVNDPHALSEEQLMRFCAAGQVLLQGWGKLTREKNNWTIKTLVEAGLSMLPVTDKVAAKLEGADA